MPSVKAHFFFYGLDTTNGVLALHPIQAIQSKDDVEILLHILLYFSKDVLF